MYGDNEGFIDMAFKFVAVPFLGGLLGIIGVFVNMMLNMVIAIPFWIFWTIFGIGAKYFSFLPITYQAINLWHCIGIFACLGLIKMICFSRGVNVSAKK